MNIKNLLLATLSFLALSCSNDENNSSNSTTEEAMYFPPIGSDTWATKTPESLGWNTNNIQQLYDYLELKNSRSFMVLHNGKIVLEKYFGTHTATTPWYWASAGKTLTSTVTGIAEQEGLININNKVSSYIGTGWTSETLAKENLITCKHLLTMTSGLDDAYNNSTDETINDCVSPGCLVYKADAGTRWAYDNVYVKLQDVVAQASGQSWSNYFNTKLRDKIGMTGTWLQQYSNSIFWSNTRSMARFGLLALANGKWDGTTIINSNYFNTATHTSQNINLAYGYLWWINGENSYHMPQSQLTFNGCLIPNAPTDMFCALGKNDQKIYVVPSKKLVIIRMGDAADSSNFAMSGFDNELWGKINLVIN